MMSLAVTPPPGLLMRTTTARVQGSAAAASNRSRKSDTGFSPAELGPIMSMFEQNAIDIDHRHRRTACFVGVRHGEGMHRPGIARRGAFVDQMSVGADIGADGRRAMATGQQRGEQ